MAMPLKVDISGSALSAAYYEHFKNSGDQEGFLLGEVTNQVSETITDADMLSKNEEMIIRIYSLLALDKAQRFYDNQGRVDETRLAAILENRHKEVVGWFRFRPNTCLEALLRERTIHDHLQNTLSECPLRFVFAIFTNSHSKNLATHTFNHVFLHDCDGFEVLPATINNLGGMSASEYKVHPDPSASPNAGLYGSIIHKFSPDTPGTIDSKAQIQSIQSASNSSLKHLASKVAESEVTIAQLVREIDLLRTQLRIRKTVAASPMSPLQPSSPAQVQRSDLCNVSHKQKLSALPASSCLITSPQTKDADPSPMEENNAERFSDSPIF